MKIAVSGASGLIGRALTERLRARGEEVFGLTRGGAGARRLVEGVRAVRWSPETGELETDALEGIDAVVHLAGESVAGRWTAAKKERIRRSRVEGTRRLVEALARLEGRPGVFLAASAIGYYGDRGDEELDESAPPGSGFLADVCGEWEAESARARELLGARAAWLRIGIVLSTRGGALGQMLTPFRLGLGGPMGSGRQWMSWIHIDDVVAAFVHALDDARLEGPANATAPSPVRNADFARTLGRVLHRPAILPAPAFAVGLLLGEMGRELLLGGQKVLPRRLEAAGFRWTFPELEPALRDLLATKK